MLEIFRSMANIEYHKRVILNDVEKAQQRVILK